MTPSLFYFLTPVFVLALVLSYWIFRSLPDWKIAGRIIFALLNLAVLLYLGAALFYLFEFRSYFFQFIVMFFIFVLTWISFIFAELEFFNLFNVVFRKKWSRVMKPFSGQSDYFPFVSLHVPISNEPPEIVKKNLDNLSRLDYANFEVIVVDNNTKLEETWRPVEDYCRELGPRFQFFHKAVMSGAKAEALNFALSKTHPTAEIIGVIDSDYIVDRRFLKATVPYFQDSQTAIIQTPQDWRDFDKNGFLGSCYLVYRYFFSIVMRSANEHNAASFMGTMGLIRKTALQEIGGWREGHLTEDIEIGLRVHFHGYKSYYLHHSFGGGEMPREFAVLRNQRIRWIFGNAQVLKTNWKAFFSFSNHCLSFAQKICYIGALAVWFNNLFFLTFLLIGMGILHLFWGGHFFHPFVFWSLFILFPLFLIRRALGFLIVLKWEEEAPWKRVFEAFLVFLSLSWVMSIIWLFSFFKSSREDYRKTPKAKLKLKHSLFRKQYLPLREELGLGASSLFLAAAIWIFSGDSLNWLIVAPLLFLALINLAPLWSVYRFSKT